MTMLATAVAPTRLEGAAFDEALAELFTRSTDLDQALDSASTEPEHDLQAIASAAVDPLEIAAALEAVGVPNRTITGTFGHRDVFDLAQHIYDHVAFRQDATADDSPRSGGLADLKRGAMFAVPGLAFTDVLRAGGVSLLWWCLPLALTLGWAVGQLVASVGYALANARTRLTGGERLVLLGGLPLAAAACTVAIGAVSDSVDSTGIIVVALFVAYMAASAMLLVESRDAVLGWSLVPAGLAAAAAIWGSEMSWQAPLALGAELTAVAIVVGAALYGVPWGNGACRTLRGHELGGAAEHFVHGAGCGLLASVVLTLAITTGTSVSAGAPPSVSIASWPLLLSLGVMEWHHRTLAATLHRLNAVSVDVGRYVARARRAFMRVVACYGAAIVGFSVGVGIVGHLLGSGLSISRLGVQVSLGVMLCIDLVAITYAGVERTLRCWSVSAVVGSAGILWFTRSGHVMDFGSLRVWTLACCVLLAASLTLTACRAVSNPFQST
ncbi:MAG TPA: hypothetical protein VFN21_05620 [Acidimicrobiales bacterium]|nr:hypothetical protein [Acidimicrobiales bacterium]